MSTQHQQAESQNILSATFRGRNTHCGLYEVTERYDYHGYIFLSLKFPNQDPCPTFTIAIRKDANIPIAEGDKIEFTPQIDYKTGDIVRQKFFENDRDVIIVSNIQFWKPNVPVLEGWKKLHQPQTKFIARPR